MAVELNFDQLWAAYPTDYNPCRIDDGTSAFGNQCAIRFGVALRDGGVDLRTFRGTRCWHGHSGKHLLRGEEIVAWMKQNGEMFGDPEVERDVDYTRYLGRRGLIFCQNFWGPGLQGDHIDLWNLNEMASGSQEYIDRSERVHFWMIDASSIDFVENFDRPIATKVK